MQISSQTGRVIRTFTLSLISTWLIWISLALLFTDKILDSIHVIKVYFHYNGSNTPVAFGVNPNLWVIYSLILTLLYEYMYNRSHRPKENFRTITAQTILCAIATASIFHIFAITLETKQWAQVKPKGQPLSKPFLQDTEQFAKFCQARIPNSELTRLVYAAKEPPDQLRSLTYYLYPLRTQFSDKTPTTPFYIIIFNENHPDTMVPPDFYIIARYNEHSLIAMRTTTSP